MCLKVSVESSGNWVGEGQWGIAVEVCVCVTLDADETAGGGGS
jgi:hypothetical protein